VPFAESKSPKRKPAIFLCWLGKFPYLIFLNCLWNSVAALGGGGGGVKRKKAENVKYYKERHVLK
jgi:hypothetical protein